MRTVDTKHVIEISQDEAKAVAHHIMGDLYHCIDEQEPTNMAVFSELHAASFDRLQYFGELAGEPGLRDAVARSCAGLILTHNGNGKAKDTDGNNERPASDGAVEVEDTTEEE